MPDKRYADQTQDVVLERAKDRVSDDVDKRQGSVVHDMLSPFAAEAERIYRELDSVLIAGFVSDEQPREYLIKRAAEVGLTLLEPEKAEGELTITADDGDVIPAGARFYADEDDPIYFITLEDAEIVGETATVKAEAEMPGTESNVSAGEIRFVDGDVSGVVDVINNNSFEGGTDEESTESLKERYFKRVRRPSTSGNAADYENWARETAGVGRAKVFPTWDGPSTVKVVIADQDMAPASETIVDNVKAYIEEVRPIGADVTVESVKGKDVVIDLNLTPESGTSLSDAESTIRKNIRSYFSEISLKQGFISTAIIGSIIINSQGVADYKNLKVNGGQENVALDEEEAPVLKEINLI